MSNTRLSTGNALLAALSPADFAVLQPELKRLELPLRFELHAGGEPTEWIYFPEDGIASIVAEDANAKVAQVGLFGREGMSGTAAVLGTDRAPHRVFMQVPGIAGLRIRPEPLLAAMRASSAMSKLILAYVQATMVQSASSTAAAAGYTSGPRLARWLLMCHDRVVGDELPLTHDIIAVMLGLRRAGVTVALQALKAADLVWTARSRVIVRDRRGLENLADGSYGFAEHEYERLLGTPIRKPRQGPVVPTTPFAAAA